MQMLLVLKNHIILLRNERENDDPLGAASQPFYFGKFPEPT